MKLLTRVHGSTGLRHYYLLVITHEVLFVICLVIRIKRYEYTISGRLEVLTIPQTIAK